MKRIGYSIIGFLLLCTVAFSAQLTIDDIATNNTPKKNMIAIDANFTELYTFKDGTAWQVGETGAYDSSWAADLASPNKDALDDYFIISDPDRDGFADNMGAPTFNAALGTDDTSSGIGIAGKNAGETIAQWKAVYDDLFDTEYMLADADVDGKWPAIGLAKDAGTNGNALSIVTQGIIRNDAWDWKVKGVGTHDGADNVAIFADSGESFTTSIYIDGIIKNTTDGSQATVTANDGTTITGTLSGGTDNDWDIGDAAEFVPTGNIYLSDTAGDLTQVPMSTSGDCHQKMGKILTADKIFLNIMSAFEVK